jgi:hypothetical protein
MRLSLYNNLGRILWSALLALGVTAYFAIGVSADTFVQRFHLDALCQKADRIFRGTVLTVKTGTVTAGGGELPTVTYQIKVNETLAGPHQLAVNLTMIGEIKKNPAQQGVQRAPLLDLPRLEEGKEYLLFTTRPSAAGLSTTVGLQQGCFSLTKKEGKAYAVNGANNAGLGLGKNGPVEYEKLTAQIRALRPN